MHSQTPAKFDLAGVFKKQQLIIFFSLPLGGGHVLPDEGGISFCNPYILDDCPLTFFTPIGKEVKP